MNKTPGQFIHANVLDASSLEALRRRIQCEGDNDFTLLTDPPLTPLIFSMKARADFTHLPIINQVQTDFNEKQNYEVEVDSPFCFKENKTKKVAGIRDKITGKARQTKIPKKPPHRIQNIKIK